jgi:GMP synthase (glutamine-hydrolysing)
MKIGILQTGHAPEEIQASLGDYEHMFHRLLGGHGFDFQTWNVVDNDFPEGPDAADGWLITGSKHGVYEDHPWLPPLEALIRAIHDSGKPLVGICFGHQVIAQALGGTVVKHPGGWIVGRQDYDFDGQALSLNAWHQDQVIDLPPGARVLASNPTCAYAALAYGDTILTVQPHPEFTAEAIDGLIIHRGGAVPPELLNRARADLDKPTANAVLADRIAETFTKAAQQ